MATFHSIRLTVTCVTLVGGGERPTEEGKGETPIEVGKGEIPVEVGAETVPGTDGDVGWVPGAAQATATAKPTPAKAMAKFFP